MVNPRGLVALLAFACMRCSVSLVTPDGIRVRCEGDDECPSKRCSATVGVCIAKDDDDSPLRIASVEALDTRHIAVLFNREVDPVSAGDFTVYALSPGLSPQSAVVADDHLSVTVQTTQQKLRTYLLDVVDVVDPIGRPLERTQKEFTGIGDQVSGLSPTPLTPLDHTLFADPGVTLSWGALPDAVNYSVEIARLSGASELPISGSPFVTRETELSLVVEEDATYVWRVSADSSREPPVTSSFAVYGEALHVYCPAASDCSVADSWDAGTSGNPSRRIGRALALAAFLSRGEVRIAGRGAGAAYEEALVVTAPLARLAGGYDPAFARVDAVATPTIIRSDPNAVRVITADPLTLSDLDIRASGGSALVLTGLGAVDATRVTLSSNNGGRPLDVRRCGEEGTVHFSDVVAGGLAGGSNIPMPSRVAGGCVATFDHATITDAGIVVTAANATFVDSSLSATVGPQSDTQGFVGTETTALRLDAATAVLERSLVTAGIVDEIGNRVAIRVLPASSLAVNASTIIASRVAFADCFPEDCQGQATAIEAGAWDAARNVSIDVTNSVLSASAVPSTGDAIAAAVRWYGPGRLALLHDVIYVEDGTGLRGDVGTAVTDNRQILNTAVVCSGASVGGEDSSDVPPRLLRSTAFVGCSTPYRFLAINYSTADAIEAIGGPQPHTFTNIHVLAAPITATFPGYAGMVASATADDWSCGPVCASLGESSGDPICGADGASACASWVTVDSTGAPRTSPISIGPREVD